MQDREPTIRSRELGEGLRLALERAQLNGKQVALRLGWSESKVSRLLTGRRGGSEVEIAEFLVVCQVIGEERDRLISLCSDLDTKSWFQQFGSRLPPQVQTLIDHETKASRVREFHPVVMPGLLQTDEYARGLFMRSGTVPSNEIEGRVAARAGRRTLFSRVDPPKFTFLIHELVLRLPVGSREVMAEQLYQLIRMSVRPYMNIRVVPAKFGAHAGTAGSFSLMESREYRSVVYLEGETSGLFLEKREEVASYTNVFNLLAAAALDEGESKELIARVATEEYADREDRHDRVAEKLL